MQLKNSLIGALIGGVIGIGVLVLAYFVFGSEHTALAIVVAFLVGFGVRAKVATKGHASYLRGAVTALVALAAFVGGRFVVAEVAARKSAVNVVQQASKPAPPPKQADRNESESADASASDAAPEEPKGEPPAERSVEAEPRLQNRQPELDGPIRLGAPRKSPFSTWDFLWVCGAALVAYELGRGSGLAPAVAQTTPENSA